MEKQERDKRWENGAHYDNYIQKELSSFRKNAWKRQLGQHFAPGAALDILDESNITSAVMKSIAKAAQRRIAQRVQGAYKFAFTMFTNVRGVLTQTANFDFSELKTQ